MTRVIAPSRLHFGLFHVPSRSESDTPDERRFGGVGLMIEQPGTIVTARRATAWQIEGPLASRAQLFAQRLLAHLTPGEYGAFQILIERCPPEHVGLGVGTQLGLTIAKALAVELGRADLSAVELAQIIGRGERSAVGVHGFDRGGLIIEEGKRAGEAISPLLHALPLPVNWRVVVAIPPTASRWHGDRERSAFESVAPRDDAAHSERLKRIALTAILPAARSGNLRDFGAAVHEFNRLAGEPFTQEQGGIYAGPDVAEVVSLLQKWGVDTVGQSSWGPAVFAIVESDISASRVIERLRTEKPNLQVFTSKINVHGAQVTL